MTQPWITDRAVRVRLAIIFVLLGYLVIIVASHFIPLPLFLQPPLVLVGWLFLPGLYVWGRLRRIDTRRSALPRFREMLRPWALTAIFGALVAVALFLAIVWDVPGSCHGPVPVNCFRGYNWSTDDGRYFHTTSYGAAPSEISRQTYLKEVGFDLRSSAAFGVYAMCLAWIGAAALRLSSRPRGSAP
jgi:hypothetical protein